MNDDSRRTQTIGRFRTNLCFYHANGKGTGSAVKLNLCPAHDDTEGCIMLVIANQMTVGDRRGPNPTFSTFDWENATCVKLNFGDLAQILQVFRGETESVGAGKGLYHRSPRASTIIRLNHIIEPACGYVLDVSRRLSREGEEERHARIMFNTAEALGLCEAIAGAMCLVGFGIPMLATRDASVGQPSAKGVRDAYAA